MTPPTEPTPQKKKPSDPEPEDAGGDVPVPPRNLLAAAFTGGAIGGFVGAIVGTMVQAMTH
jgi:hypothetical protein